jgi:hypothetical protein
VRAPCLALLVVLAGCGHDGVVSAADLHSCVAKRLPAGAVDRVVTGTEEGVTSTNYYRRGNETAVSVFPSVDDAVKAEAAEARLGDAHDRRIGNVLYSGGGAVEDAVVACAR